MYSNGAARASACEQGADMQPISVSGPRPSNTIELTPDHANTRINLWLFMLAPVSFAITLLLIVYLRS